MPTTQEIIRSVRNHVANNNGYLGNSEVRTKYVLIDPLLRVLGWNTDNPAQVQLEFETGNSTKRADYALFTPQFKKPVGLVEAKLLPQEKISQFREFANQKDQAVAIGFRELQSSIGSGPPPTILLPDDEWSALKKANEGQLEGYVHELQLRAGYGILTNGDDWWIYDLKKYDLGKGVPVFADALVRGASVLFDDTQKVAGVLRLISRDRSWPNLRA